MVHSGKVLALANLAFCFDNRNILSRRVLSREMQSPSLCPSQFCCCRNKDFVAVEVIELSHKSDVMLILTNEGGLKTVPAQSNDLDNGKMECCQR
jgi:hypothetical protein